MSFHRVQAFCDLLDSRKEPFGFSIGPFLSALSLRGLFVYPRSYFGYLRIDLFERIAQRGQRLEQVVPVKAPEVGGAGVPGVFEESEPGPHSGGPLCPTGGVVVCGLHIPDVPGEDMEPGIQIPAGTCGEPTFLRIVTASVHPAVDLLDLLSKVAKLCQRFRFEERNRHGDHGQGQNAASMLDGLVRVRDYGIRWSSHVFLLKKEKPHIGATSVLVVRGWGLRLFTPFRGQLSTTPKEKRRPTSV